MITVEPRPEPASEPTPEAGNGGSPRAAVLDPPLAAAPVAAAPAAPAPTVEQLRVRLEEISAWHPPAPVRTHPARRVRVAPAHEPRVLGVGPSVVLVLLCFVVMHVPMALGLARADHPADPAIPVGSFWDSSTWGKFDTWLYLDIARGGYSLHPCTEGEWAPTDWCGNAGWTPAYPGAVRMTSYAHLQEETAAFLLSRLFTLGALGVLWFAIFGRRLAATTVGALLLASVWPGSVYLLALYPMSLMVLGLFGVAYFLARERPLLAGACAAVVATSHTTGFFIVPIAIVAIALDVRDRRLLRTARSIGLFVLLPLAGLAAMFLTFLVTTGRWDALQLSQQKYGHHLQLGPAALFERISLLWNDPEHLPRALAGQSLLVATMMTAVLLTVVFRWSRLHRIERIAAVLALGFWLVPLFYGRADAAYYRVELLTIPAVVLFRRLPTPALYALIAVAAVLSAIMTTLFVEARLT